MAVSPDDFFIIFLSIMLSTEEKSKFKSHRYIAFSLGNILLKFNTDIYVYVHTIEMSIYLLHDKDIQIDQLH